MLKKRIAELEAGPSVTQNITNTNNIVINNFGCESIEHILKDKAFLESVLASLTLEGVPKIAEKIYYSPEHPENHTVFLKSSKRKEVMVRENGNWRIKSFSQTIPKMISKTQNVLLFCMASAEEEDFETQLKKNAYVSDLFVDDTQAFKKAATKIESLIGNYKFSSDKV